MFNYTNGRTTFAGTAEYNLEAKGVVPDIRVPVTVESEQAKRTGKDPVLEAAITELSRASNRRVAQLVAQPWQWANGCPTRAPMRPSKSRRGELHADLQRPAGNR